MGIYTPLEWSQIEPILDKKTSELHKCIEIAPMFMSWLVRDEILTHEEKQDIEDCKHRSERKQMLTDHLHKGSVRHFVYFCCILVEDMKRPDIITEHFGLEIDHIKQQRDELKQKEEKQKEAVGSNTPTSQPPPEKHKEEEKRQKDVASSKTPTKGPESTSHIQDHSERYKAKSSTKQSVAIAASSIKDESAGRAFMEEEMEIEMLEVSESTSVPNMNKSLQWMHGSFTELKKDLGESVKDVIIAVIDTGIYTGHPDLAGMVIDSKNFVKKPVVDGVSQELDLEQDARNHGTMCAGILTLAHNVKIVNLKVLRSNGKGTTAYRRDALNYVKTLNEQKKVDIISMSTGGGAYLEDESTLLTELSKDTVLIAAASNIGQRKADTIAFPARHRSVIAVGSCDRLGNRCAHSAKGADLAFLFPGEDIWSTSSEYRTTQYGRYTKKSGTSFAAPHCSALVAIILALIEKWYGERARKLLTTSYHMMNIIRLACPRTSTELEGHGLPYVDRINRGLIDTYLTENKINVYQ